MEKKRGRGRQGGVSCKDGAGSKCQSRQSSCYGKVRQVSCCQLHCRAQSHIVVCSYSDIALGCLVKIETKS